MHMHMHGSTHAQTFGAKRYLEVSPSNTLSVTYWFPVTLNLQEAGKRTAYF